MILEVAQAEQVTFQMGIHTGPVIAGATDKKDMEFHRVPAGDFVRLFVPTMPWTMQVVQELRFDMIVNSLNRFEVTLVQGVS